MNRFLLNHLPLGWMDAYIQYKSKDESSLKKLVFDSDPETLELLGRRKALAMLRKTARDIRHYRDFLQLKNVKMEDIRSIEDFISLLPSIDKENYIRKAGTLHELCFKDNDQPEFLVRSSGFTGRPITWIESKDEIESARKYVSFGMDMLFSTKKRSTLIINGFALGSWSGGISMLVETEEECSLINPGLVEKEIIELVTELKDEYDQIIIAGNPVFLKDIVDESHMKGLGWNRYRIHLITGGELITEAWRDYMLCKLNPKETKIYSAFGASDIGVVGFNETNESIKIRKAAITNAPLRKALFDETEELPMLFQYDPTRYFITVSKGWELEFTKCDLGTLMPLIKYNLHDVGGIISHKKMEKILRDFSLHVDLKFPFPFIFVQGRSDGTISFCSSKIYPANIEEAIFSSSNLSASTTGRFKLLKKYGADHNSHLHVTIQLEKNKAGDRKLKERFTRAIHDSLMRSNADFRQDITHMKNKGKKIIDVELIPFEQYPVEPSIKERYIE